MILPPLSVIATWPKPNYVNPNTRGPIVFIADSIFLILATVAVAIRLFTRVAIRRWVGADDVFIIFAFILNLGLISIVFHALLSYGWDRHIYDVPFSVLEPAAKSLFAFKLVWASASASIRLSLLCFFDRLLQHIDMRQYRWIIHLNVCFVVAIWVCFVGTTVFTYLPVKAYWTFPPIHHDRRISERIAFTVLSCFNTVSELLIATMPIPMVFRKLHMPPMQRWSVIGLLSLGFLVAAVGAIRTYYGWIEFSTYDHTWYATPYLVASEVELDTALICACAPAMRPFFTRAFSRWSKSSTSASRGYLAEGRVALTESTLLSKLSERSNSDKLGSVTTTRDGSPWASSTQLYDIEGIATEGFGYKVTISADPSANQKDRLRLRKRRHNDQRANGADGTLKGDDRKKPLERGLLARSTTLIGSLPFWGKTKEAEGVERGDGLKVHTTQSVEVRQSFHSASQSTFLGFDFRNVQIGNEFPSSRFSSEQSPVKALSRQERTRSLREDHCTHAGPESAMNRFKSVPYSAFNKPDAASGKQRLSSSSRTQSGRNASATAPVNSSQTWALRRGSWSPLRLAGKGAKRGNSWYTNVESIDRGVGRNESNEYKPSKTF